MRVAITGTSGLIGSHVVEYLRARGDEVVPMSRPSSASAGDLNWDPTAGLLDPESLVGIDAIIHLAGEPIGARRWTPEQKQRLRVSRTQSTELIANTLASRPDLPRVFLCASAIGYYGDRGEEQLTEAAEPGDDFLSRLCIEWERSTQPAARAGVRTVNLRTGIVLSTTGGALAKQLPFFRFGLGGRSGRGTQYQSWISLLDEVRAIAWLLDHDISGPVNLTAPNPVTNAEFARTLGKVLHRPTSVIPMLGPRLAIGRELADALLLTSTRAIPTALSASGFAFSDTTLAPTLERLIAEAS